MNMAITKGVCVSVETEYLEEQSVPEQNLYLFAYHVTIKNQSSLPVKLISRHWVITDGNGKVEEVRGPGVIGQQPLIMPGEQFDYTSGSRLETPVGTMNGSYQMVSTSGQEFDAEIPVFRLSALTHLN